MKDESEVKETPKVSEKKFVNGRDQKMLETPQNLNGSSESANRTKFSANSGGLYQDNSEYSSYVTATSNSTKIREYSSESLNSRSINHSQLAD